MLTAKNKDVSVLCLQVVEVTEEFDDGWSKGRIGSEVGVFPSNYVEIISSEDLSPLSKSGLPKHSRLAPSTQSPPKEDEIEELPPSSQSQPPKEDTLHPPQHGGVQVNNLLDLFESYLSPSFFISPPLSSFLPLTLPRPYKDTHGCLHTNPLKGLFSM